MYKVTSFRCSNNIRELKKLRRLLSRKRYIKIVLRLFHVGHVVQNRRGVHSRAWHEWFSFKGKE